MTLPGEFSVVLESSHLNLSVLDYLGLAIIP